MTQFRDHVEAGFRQRVPLSTYLTALGVSERRLRRACGLVAHRTPMQMVLDRAMLDACRMLISSNRTAAEIGYECGFDDPTYFSRVFRTYTGQSLRAFRRREP